MNYNTGVTFPSDIEDWLVTNATSGTMAFVAENTAEILDVFRKLEIPSSSELFHLYVNHGSSSVVGWYELNDFDMIEEVTRYAHEELGVPKHFIALTSIEGQGITLYCRKTGRIFEVEYGRFETLAAGELECVAETVVDFLRWCKSRDT